ncbi:ABC transporter permease [Bogoriella caseilytica]|uniref:Peptide/nickel transport system permease protein n=1 Tax=Bogoriella caseilytica TaxID=56055 RepID=A0A3N2BDI7_9MICO|nr:ABC transporter permease [Bogoriella caseilytica]ROR73295.1 peptide/nickel transport system permease protein [Bogoriella caseilytica]
MVNQTEAIAPPPPLTRRARTKRLFGQLRLLDTLRRDKIGAIGAVLVVVMTSLALFAPWVAPFDPLAMSSGNRLVSPSTTFLLGSDEAGRDLLSRALYGARTSLVVSLTVVIIAGLVGVTLGLISGYFRGIIDGVTMRFMDIIFAFPTLLLALAVVATLGPEVRNLVIALSIVFVPSFARVTRGAALAISAEPYVEAARSVGVANHRVISRYVLPNVMAPIAVQFTISLANVILVEASLGYLGLGVPPPTPSWGAMLASGKSFIELSMWPSVVPGLFIMVTVLGFNLLGDSLRDSLDPRLRLRN